MAHAAVEPDEHSPISTCTTGSLPPEVDLLVKPVLLARVAAARSHTEWDESFENQFYKLLKMKGATALEAQVALMSYYTGEHYGEELLETVLKKSKQADPLVRRYRECRPRTSFEDQLDGVMVLRTLYDIYEQQHARKK
jgi:hypothetical protein